MKIELFRYDSGFFFTPPCTMIATAPQTVAPAVDLEQTIQKNPLPAVPLKRPCGVPSYTLRFSWFVGEPDQFMTVFLQSRFFVDTNEHESQKNQKK